ncbi:MAG: ABC transporter ATP-binding protein [Rhodospirillales bacterium]|nr:ABC transporter ATP-binding protein [Rhodospirillales bacterium]
MHVSKVEARAPDLEVAGAVRRFGTVEALAGIDLAVGAGELLTILGPSGSGKTTLLKVIAGFERPDRGRVLLKGRDITWSSPAQRGIGMVFQNYALFPHMTVAQNVAFPLEMRRVPRAEARRRVDEALRLVDLAGYGERLPKQLSGGQQQRVALARAVVFDPGLLLLDEPFGALDRQLREQMQLEVKRLQRRLGLTALFVTHDQEEALVLSDRIAVMNRGRIEQLGTPQEIYARPSTRFVAQFIGESNLFRARVRDNVTAVLDDGRPMPLPRGTGFAPGSEIAIVIRPERPRRIEAGEDADFVMEGVVSEIVYVGESLKYRLRDDDGLELLVRWPFRETGSRLGVGDRVAIGWSAEDAHVVSW